MRPSQAQISTRNGSTVKAKVTNVNTKKFVVTVRNAIGQTRDCSANIKVNPKPTPVNGVCGPAARNYAFNQTAFSGALCSKGSAVGAVFPGQGGSDAYTCSGQNGGRVAQCTATRDNPPAPTCVLTFSPSSVEEDTPSTASITSTNAVSATINRSVGTINPNGGTKTVTQSGVQTLNYVATVTNSAGATNTCNANLTTTAAPVPGQPAIDIIKRDTDGDNNDTQAVDPGGVATFEIEVINIGTEILNNVVVTDTLVPNCDKTFATLAVGASEKYTCQATNVTAGFTNTASVAAVSALDGMGVSDSDTSNVTVNNPSLPVCTSLTLNPTTLPSGGGNVALTWVVENTTSVTITDDAGTTVGQFINGATSTTVSVSTTTTFTLAAADGNGNVDNTSCVQTVTVEDPVNNPAPTCTLVATPDSFTAGGGTTVLEWTTTNAVSASIDNGIGAVTPVETGTTSAAVTNPGTTRFEMTVTGADGQTRTCFDDVVVETPQTGRTCEISASVTQIDEGDTFSLSWTTTGVSSVNLNRGLGNGLQADESSFGVIAPAVSDDTPIVFRLTSDEGAFDNAPCEVTVIVQGTGGGGGGGSSSGSSRPRCEFDISDDSISAGEEVTLSWETVRASEITIFKGDDDGEEIFNTEDDDEAEEGTLAIRPTESGIYTLVAERNNRSRSCTVEVDIENDVVVLETRSQEPRVAGIALTQVPHTGFEAGPTLTFIFYALLTLWALFVAYAYVLKRRPSAAGVVTSEDENFKKKLQELSQKYQNPYQY